MPGSKTAEARRLSFRALDIEQIGHVYEGLLDHTARRADEPFLGLAGGKDKEPEIPLAKLESVQAKGETELVKWLKEETGKTEKALTKSLAGELDVRDAARFRTACGGVEALWTRVEPFAGLIRPDTFGYPVILPQGQRVCDRRHRSAVQWDALQPPKPDRAHRSVHAGAARLHRACRRASSGSVEAPVGQGTFGPKDLRHGLWVGGVPRPGLPIPGSEAS